MIINETIITKMDRYEGIDGLKAYSILGIVLMHILANGKYEVEGVQIYTLGCQIGGIG